MAEDFGFKVQKKKRAQEPLTAWGADKKVKRIAGNKAMPFTKKIKAGQSVVKRAGPNSSKMKGYSQ